MAEAVARRIRTDVCVIGAGSGGLSVAAGAVQMGARVVLIEAHLMGGDCLNFGCVPSKALLAVAKQAQTMRSGAKFGVAPVEPEVDYAAAKDHVRKVIETIAPVDSRGSSAPKFSDFAVLYRANHQARVFEQKLRAAQLPYKVSGGQSFFDRAEIKDLCAWLRLLVNPDDDPAFLRAVTTPKRGIGHTTLGSLGEFAAKWKVSLFEALFSPTLPTVLKGKAIDLLHAFGREVNELQHRAAHTTGAEDAKALLMGWLKDIGYEQHLYDSEDSEKLAQSRWTNVLDFVDWIARRCGGEIRNDGGLTEETERQTVLQVAQTISIIISLAERDAEQDVITLSTLHAAKGLEWPHVVLAGVNEGLLPFKSGDEDMTPERLEEERRLMYVGITRARLTLTVSTLMRRKKGRETVAGIPSRFIAEMKLEEAGAREDPRERLKRLRAELVAKAGTPPA